MFFTCSIHDLYFLEASHALVHNLDILEIILAYHNIIIIIRNMVVRKFIHYYVSVEQTINHYLGSFYGEPRVE
jgi:hypothetical protein